LGFLVDKLALGEGFALPLSLHKCPVLFFIFILPLSEGRGGKVWELSKKGMDFPKSGSLLRLSLFKRGQTSEAAMCDSTLRKNGMNIWIECGIQEFQIRCYVANRKKES
jgi:hypothetical protein